jgi:HD-GYP domain-containing protein (c-di-GMP phosphodiesterase class II)
MAIEATIIEIEAQLQRADAPVTRSALMDAANRLLSEKDAASSSAASTIGFRVCQALYQQARSFDALPLALAAFQRANELGEAKFLHQAATVCGVLSSDTADFASAVEFHGRALDIMSAQDNAVGASRAWNNIGSTLSSVGRYELASQSYRHSLEKIEGFAAPQFSRFSALTNLASSCYHLNQVDSGLAYSFQALDELQSGFAPGTVDSFSQVLLHRNIVRLLVANNDLARAEDHVRLARELSAKDGGVRANIAATTAQATIEIARGQTDIAVTRLERCLDAARPVRVALRDTLASMIRADEAMGNSARALVRLQELSELVHQQTAESATGHVALADWRSSITALSDTSGLTGLGERLVLQRGVSAAPPMWPTLVRIALGNSLQIDPTAAHGVRVGTLSRLLALSIGMGPLRSLEIGLAAQIHDIGLAVGHENLVGRQTGSAGNHSAEDDPTHCDTGWAILCDDSHPRVLLAREIAKYHHAWWNGEGFPVGIAGSAIPTHARICAVADVYDTLVHDGVVEGATIASNLARLRSFSGTRLDPELVEQFVDALQNETRNEGIEFESGRGLHSFHQLIKSLSSAHRHL